MEKQNILPVVLHHYILLINERLFWSQFFLNINENKFQFCKKKKKHRLFPFACFDSNLKNLLFLFFNERTEREITIPKRTHILKALIECYKFEMYLTSVSAGNRTRRVSMLHQYTNRRATTITLPQWRIPLWLMRRNILALLDVSSFNSNFVDNSSIN